MLNTYIVPEVYECKLQTLHLHTLHLTYIFLQQANSMQEQYYGCP